MLLNPRGRYVLGAAAPAPAEEPVVTIEAEPLAATRAQVAEVRDTRGKPAQRGKRR